MSESDLINAMTSKGHTVDTAKAAIAGRGFADLAREYLGINSSSTSSTSDPLQMAKQIRQFNVEANQPAISSLTNQIGEIGQNYAAQRTYLEAQKNPLEARYQNILDQINNVTKQQVGSTELETSREFGKRGISQQSGVFDQTLNSRINPILENEKTTFKEVGLAKEEGLMGLNKQISDLIGGETADKRQVQNAIASLMAGDPQSSVSGALQLLSMKQSSDQFLKSQELQASQFDRNLTEEQRQFNEEQNRLKSNTGASTQASKTETARTKLLQDAAGGATLTDLTKNYGANIPLKDIVALYTATSRYGAPTEQWAIDLLKSDTSMFGN